jgi:hypothetical protein
MQSIGASTSGLSVDRALDVKSLYPQNSAKSEKANGGAISEEALLRLMASFFGISSSFSFLDCRILHLTVPHISDPWAGTFLYLF